MTDGNIHPDDVRLYRRLVGLSVQQLAAIRARLSGDPGRWKSLVFKDRNRRLKKTLLKILDNKQRRLGEGDLAELLEDLKKIEVDEGAWQTVGKEELDYVQIVLHGLREVAADENGLLDDCA
jgi:hypothetical protein